MPKLDAKYLDDLLRQGINPADYAMWKITFLEPSKLYGAELLDMLRYHDAGICRGWLVPERAMTEASISGSRADSQGAADLALTASDDLLHDVIDCINRCVLNPLLRVNFGSDAEGAVVVEPGQIDKDKQAQIFGLVSQILTNPANADLLDTVVDFGAMLDQAEIPRRESTVNPQARTLPTSEPAPTDNATAMAAFIDSYKAVGRASNP